PGPGASRHHGRGGERTGPDRSPGPPCPPPAVPASPQWGRAGPDRAAAGGHGAHAPSVATVPRLRRDDRAMPRLREAVSKRGPAPRRLGAGPLFETVSYGSVSIDPAGLNPWVAISCSSCLAMTLW